MDRNLTNLVYSYDPFPSLVEYLLIIMTEELVLTVRCVKVEPRPHGRVLIGGVHLLSNDLGNSVVQTEPHNAEGEEERVLIATRVTQSCKERERGSERRATELQS